MAIVIVFWLKWTGYLAVASLNLLAEISDSISPDNCVKPNVRRLAHLASDSAHSLTHYQDLSYQIFELEDSGLPQQGILPISARKTTTKAIHRCLEKTLSTVLSWQDSFTILAIALNRVK